MPKKQPSKPTSTITAYEHPSQERLNNPQIKQIQNPVLQDEISRAINLLNREPLPDISSPGKKLTSTWGDTRSRGTEKAA